MRSFSALTVAGLLAFSGCGGGSSTAADAARIDAPIAADGAVSDSTSGGGEPDATVVPDGPLPVDAAVTDGTPLPDSTPADASLCGNGSIDEGEMCDIAIPAGQEGACPTGCGGDLCSTGALVGTGCAQHCDLTPRPAVDGDGICCPPGTDADCADTAFRVVTMGLYDPHVTTTALTPGVCSDQIALVNSSIHDDILQFKLNLVLRFRPLDDRAGDMTPTDFLVAACDDTGCAPGTSTLMSMIENSALGQTAACTQVLPGTDSGYSAIVTPAPPCFTGGFGTVSFTIATLYGPVSVLLEDVQVGATYDPANDQLIHGLIRGFLTDDAAATLLFVGNPLSNFLPGGAGNCSTTDDTDLRAPDDKGWFFYFKFSAMATTFTP